MTQTQIVLVVFIFSLIANVGLIYYITDKFIPASGPRNHPVTTWLLGFALVLTMAALTNSTIYLTVHLMIVV